MKETNSLDGKLIILYILDKVKQDISLEQIQKIYYEYEAISYFYMQQYLFDLQAKNLIEAYIDNDITTYRLTDIGKASLDGSLDIVPGIDIHRLNKAIEHKVMEIKKEYTVNTEFLPLNDNAYKLTCYIKEGNEDIISISMYAGSRENAKVISDNWKRNSEQLYPEILKLLTTIEDKKDEN